MIGRLPPCGWTGARLDDLAVIERDGVAPEQIPSGVLYVGLEHIEGSGEFQGVRPVENGDLASTKFRFTPEHILYGKLRPYLRKIARPSFEGVCSTDILPIRPKRGVCRDYLFHYLRHPRVVEEATARCEGANLPRLSPHQLASFPVWLPPTEAEQKRIAAILDKADAIRRRRQEAARLADQLIPSLFYEMFNDPGRNPHGWPVIPVGELILDGPQNGLYRPSTDYGSGTRIVRIDSFYSGELRDIPNLKRVRIDGSTLHKFRLAPDDVLINRVNSTEFLGKCALVPDHDEPMVFESNMMRMRLDTDRVHPRFLVAMLQTQHVRTQILRQERAAVNQSSINQEDVRSFKFPLPPIGLQRRYAERVPLVLKLRDFHTDQAARADDLFSSLVQRAFRGEL
jgi:type I restriction enzyme S subunit